MSDVVWIRRVVVRLMLTANGRKRLQQAGGRRGEAAKAEAKAAGMNAAARSNGIRDDVVSLSLFSSPRALTAFPHVPQQQQPITPRPMIQQPA
jgi:hypothetical protein